MSDNIKKQHISSAERDKWNAHIGASGTGAHPIANGTNAGFSTNNYTTTEKNNLNTLVQNVGDLRITIGGNGPSSPRANKEIWFDTDHDEVIKVYTASGWKKFGAVFL